MGWIYQDGTRQSVLDEVLEKVRADVRIVDQARMGHNEWLLVADPADSSKRWITLVMMNRVGAQWGHKLISESQSPSSINCPKRLLDQSTEFPCEWREHAYLELENVGLAGKTLTPGAHLSFNGYTYRLNGKIATNSWNVTELSSGNTYSASQYALAHAVLDTYRVRAKSLYEQQCQDDPQRFLRQNRLWGDFHGQPWTFDRMPHSLQAFLVNQVLQEHGATQFTRCATIGAGVFNEHSSNSLSQEPLMAFGEQIAMDWGNEQPEAQPAPRMRG